PRDRGEDREDVAVGELGVEPLEVADVVVVLVDVDELVQAALVVEEVLAQAGILLDEGTEDVADGRAVDTDRRLAVGLGSQNSGELHLDRHGAPFVYGNDFAGYNPSSGVEISGSLRASPARPGGAAIPRARSGGCGERAGPPPRR